MGADQSEPLYSQAIQAVGRVEGARSPGEPAGVIPTGSNLPSPRMAVAAAAFDPGPFGAPVAMPLDRSRGLFVFGQQMMRKVLGLRGMAPGGFPSARAAVERTTDAGT